MTELNEFSHEVEFPPLTAVFVDEQPPSGHRSSLPPGLLRGGSPTLYYRYEVANNLFFLIDRHGAVLEEDSSEYLRI